MTSNDVAEGGPKRSGPAELAALIWAGESIYLLPYALRREYRTTLIEALGLANESDLGAIYSVFGILSLLAYPAGGWLADRASPRVLLPVSLVLTAAGGVVLSTFPSSPATLYGLFALWAISTILLFWAALIKATRTWGGSSAQGRAFGVLDSGRGLLAAIAASIGLQMFALLGGGAGGLRAVIFLYTGACLLGAAATWLALPRDVESRPTGVGTPDAGTSLRDVLSRPSVWLIGGMIFCAYCAYYGTFYIAGFATAAYGQTAAGGAAVSVFALWLRPIAPVIAGLAADRTHSRTVVGFSFGLLVVSLASLALVPPAWSGLPLLYVQSALLAGAAFALRGVYYALLAEGGLPPHLTGTAVGVVAFVGYLPDVITPYAWGRLLDALPGEAGYRVLFGSLAALSLLGILLAQRFRPAPETGRSA